MKILDVLTKQRKIGNKGEKIAVKSLKKEGYKILERNYVAFSSEIDIIAENKTTLAFIEVKTRTVGKENPREARPASAVTPDKQRKIINAAKCYIATHRAEKRISLDVIEVYLTLDGRKDSVIHIENTFNRNSAYEREYKKR